MAGVVVELLEERNRGLVLEGRGRGLGPRTPEAGPGWGRSCERGGLASVRRTLCRSLVASGELPGHCGEELDGKRLRESACE